MKSMILSALILSGSSLFVANSAHANDNDFSFTLGTGFPYVGSAEVSMAAGEGKQRWFGHYKVGPDDDGFAVGFEQALDSDNNHAVGVMYGALGLKNDDSDCPSDTDLSFSGALGCALSAAFDWETVNGLGVSYSYYFNGLNEAGWRVRLEAGKGKGRNTDKSYTSGNMIVSYQF